MISYHIISYHIVDLKRQNRLKVGTNKPKLKVKMQSCSVRWWSWCPERTSWTATFWTAYGGERCIQTDRGSRNNQAEKFACKRSFLPVGYSCYRCQL